MFEKMSKIESVGPYGQICIHPETKFSVFKYEMHRTHRYNFDYFFKCISINSKSSQYTINGSVFVCLFSDESIMYALKVTKILIII